MIFRARQFEFAFPRPALVMGIVNVTPDSFSDGGRYFAADAAIDHALQLVQQGAEILDIGGESTRPGAGPVGEAEELRRVIPVVETLASQVKVPISIDTMKPAVAVAALSAGASIVNDVAASRNDNAGIWQAVAEFQAGYVCMHAFGSGQGILPPSLHEPAGSLSPGGDIVRGVEEFFRERLKQLIARGLSSDQIVFDPGIGFGKGLEQNLTLLANLRSFTTWQRPVLVGVSRKSFIGKLLGAPVDERLPASLACATLAVAAGVQLIRTHDVAETVQAIRLAEAVLARTKT
jgi:dihydropteroate synthase